MQSGASSIPISDQTYWHKSDVWEDAAMEEITKSAESGLLDASEAFISRNMDKLKCLLTFKITFKRILHQKIKTSSNRNDQNNMWS